MRNERLTASASEREAEYPPRKSQLKEDRSVLQLLCWAIGRWSGRDWAIREAPWGRAQNYKRRGNWGKNRQAQVGLKVSKQPLGIWLELSVNGRGRYGLEVMNTRVEITLRLPDLAMT